MAGALKAMGVGTTTLILCALECEARPVIQTLKMLRVPSRLPFKCFQGTYQGEVVDLAISGVGPLRASAVVSAFFALGAVARVINLGVAGACSKRNVGVGDALLINKFVQRETGRCYYPDISFSHPLEEAWLLTSMVPVCKTKPLWEMALFDMEGAAVAQLVECFGSPGDYCAVKVVSDIVTPEGSAQVRLSEKEVEFLISSRMEAVLEVMEKLHAISPDRSVFTCQEQQLLEDLANVLRLSVAQRSELDMLAKGKKLRSQNLQDLASFLSMDVRTKREASEAFFAMKQALCERRDSGCFED
jgi:nucleoside phosphorylase